MKTKKSADVHVVLRQMRTRQALREFLDGLGQGALIVGGGLVVVEAGMHFFDHARMVDLGAALAWAPFAVLLIAARVFLRRRSPEEIAELVDRRGATKDRLATALALSRETPAPGTLGDLARSECADFLGRTDFRPLVPLHPPRSGAWVVVPLVAFALLRFDSTLERSAAREQAARAQAAIADTVAQIEDLARKAQEQEKRTPDEELKKLAEQISASAERLRAETNLEEAKKAALRELSSLEESMRELQRRPSAAEEIKELARALAQMPGMEEVLRALNENNLAEAQRALQRAQEMQKSAPTQPNEAEVEKTIREAMQNLADRRELSEALQKLAEQMKQQSGDLSQQAMQQLAQMLQQAQKNQGGAGDSNSTRRQMTMKELLSALENAKFGEGKSPGGQDGKPGGEQQITMESFAKADPDSPRQPGAGQQPTGTPGSERDFGTTATPFGEKSAPQEKGGELALKGQLGPGETLSMTLPSAGDRSTSARRYKDLYEAAAASAQDTVQQENIPLGSRFLIKRYFEAIRPQE